MGTLLDRRDASPAADGISHVRFAVESGQIPADHLVWAAVVSDRLRRPRRGASVVRLLPWHRQLSTPWKRRLFLIALCFMSALVSAEERQQSRSQPRIDYQQQIAPILATHCLACHGREKQESGLRLDRRDRALAGGDNGRAILPGQAANSEFIQRITATDNAERMPPAGPPLTSSQIELLTRWIDQGAAGLPEASNSEIEHWAFRPIRPKVIPVVSGSDWCNNPIDHYVLSQLENRGLTPSPAAAPATLVRRLSLDLLGLPPDWQRVQEFINDVRPDAWERLVDEFLASPHYGERWGRHWLDLARYADSSGYEADTPREIWPYRDWVIAALNRDMPFDQFVTEQIAGDLLPHATEAQHLATGFHCNAMLDPGVRWESIMDRVNTTGTVFLGLTLGCAQCHSHKTDPVSQREYYQLYAFFNEASVTPFARSMVDGDKSKPDHSLVMKASPQPTRILKRGDPGDPGDVVQPDVPSAFDWSELPPGHRTRIDLAKWLVSSNNPLTARVTVNRVWQRYFGLGLVETENDFGLQTPPASHPELLDWLANDFRSNAWNFKRLHRLIVTSTTYQQSSQGRPNLAEIDPRNRLLTRQRRLRLEAEIIRDVALNSCGLLSRTLGGPSVFPPQADGMLDNRATPATWIVSKDSDRYRRGMYTWIWRLTPHPHSTLFDGPDTVSACTRRDRSNVPVQALTLLNDPTFLECAQRLGRLCSDMSHRDNVSTIKFLFATCLSRPPDEREQRILLQLLNAQRMELSEDDAREVIGRDTDQPINEAAWVVVCRTIMNTDEFITRE
jgi:mono/diheme cytochrome c family protein